jgi:hypothetical protein
VRDVAAIATDEADFFARLAHAGVRVKLRRSHRDPEQVTGYAVGIDGHSAASGDTVWYGRGRLAPDLTLPHDGPSGPGHRQRRRAGTRPGSAGVRVARQVTAPGTGLRGPVSGART